MIVRLAPSGGIDGTLVGFATAPAVYARIDEAFRPGPRHFATVEGKVTFRRSSEGRTFVSVEPRE